VFQLATAKQHNQIMNYVFEGNKHLKHVLTDDDIKQMTMIEGRFPLTKLPVCGHCEKLGLWHRDPYTQKNVGVCRSCGAVTKKPVTYSSYLASGYDVDATGTTFRQMAMVEKNKELVKRFIYLPDFNKLEGCV
jgi:hypothetical protein